MSEKTYQISRDSNNRLCAEIAKGVAVGIKVLSETDPRRIERNEHAYAVLDLETSMGRIRIRDIRVCWSEPNQRFYLRWKQWKTGKMRNDRPEYLDIAGPQDRETRQRFSEKILDVFDQIKKEAALGTLGRANPELVELKASLEKAEEAKPSEAPVVDGPAAEPAGEKAPETESEEQEAPAQA